jgi:hypothetical protein
MSWSGVTNTIDTFTAPTIAFSPTALAQGTEIQMYGYLDFYADNDSAPTLIEIPTANDFPTLLTQDLQGFGASEVDTSVPEPTAMLLPVVGGISLLRRHRSRRAIP